MIISHTHKFVFYSNPKTGSESVRALLADINEETIVKFDKTSAEQPFYPHMRPVEVRQVFAQRGIDFDQYQHVVVTRNPWARLVSTYENIYWYHLHTKKPWFRHKPCFEKWLRDSRPDNQGGGGIGNRRWLTYGTYALQHFAGDEDGNLLTQHIIKLENIDIELPRALEQAGLIQYAHCHVPRVNTLENRKPAKRRRYNEFYSPATRDLVAERYQFEIDKFGYQFGAA